MTLANFHRIGTGYPMRYKFPFILGPQLFFTTNFISGDCEKVQRYSGGGLNCPLMHVVSTSPVNQKNFNFMPLKL